jgi:proliferating cell nuclear antigen
MVDFEWPKTVFEEYVCSDALKVCINISELLKLLRRARRDESVELSIDEKTGRLQMTIRGNYVRTFHMPTLEPFDDEVPTPKVVFNAKAEITTEGLRQAIGDASLVSNHVRIYMDDEKMTMNAEGDLMGAAIQLKREDGAILGVDVTQPSNAIFSLSYLSEIVKSASATSEIVTLEFSTDMPIRLDFKQPQEGKLVFYLAPRIEVE